MAINHPFIKLYPKYSEQSKTIKKDSNNDYDETEEDEEKELMQINKTMCQDTRSSSPPSKQDVSSTKLSQNTQKEDNKKKMKKNHVRNWNSYTEFKV